MPNNLPKIAWLSPLPPQRSGIANYSQRLIRALRSHFAIDLYYDTDKPAAEIQNAFDVYPVSVFPERYRNYDEVIYNLSPFMHEAFYHQPDGQLYKQALVEGYGEAGRKEFQALMHGGFPDIARFPLSHAVVRRSRKAIVHHRWVKNQFGNNTHIEVIPHFAELNCRPTQAQIKNFKKKFAIRDNNFVLSCLG